MMRRICDYGLKKIKQWEGLRTTAYQDEGGVWTIGYGHTKEAGYPFPEKGMKINIHQAEQLLKKDLAIFEKAIVDFVKVPLNDYQFSALVSFCYNIGIDAFKKSTLLKQLNKKRYHLISSELLRWIFVKGKPSQGLINRRQAEIALWNKDNFVVSHYVTPQIDSKISKQCTTFLPFISTISGFGTVLSGSGPVQWVFAFGLMGAFIGCFYILWHKYRTEFL